MWRRVCGRIVFTSRDSYLRPWNAAAVVEAGGPSEGNFFRTPPAKQIQPNRPYHLNSGQRPEPTPIRSVS